jgi:uncharacterized protein (UPF0332 family)
MPSKCPRKPGLWPEQRCRTRSLSRGFPRFTGLHLRAHGKTRKTHQGVQSEFHRLALNEPRIDKAFPPFLTQAYNLKAVADYETGDNSDIPPERSAAAIKTAARFLDCIAGLLGEGA